ncbi:MAG: FliH/SctL family protein [Phycisphaeraceae bacterium]|nr:FliH/SctL family protein [Phycisphaeraceae bacterium]
MALIKSSRAQAAVRDAIVLDLGDLKQEAERLRSRAEAEAEQILTAARQRAQTLAAEAEAEARDRGFAEGRAEGHAQGVAEGRAEAMTESRDRLTALETRWTEAVGQWEADRNQIRRDAETSLLQLAEHLARRIVHRVPKLDPTVVIDQIDSALEHVLGPVRVTVRVHPEDRELAAEALPRWTHVLAEATAVEVVDDPAVERGGCVVVHGAGLIDATLERQLDRMVAALLPSKEEGDS